MKRNIGSTATTKRITQQDMAKTTDEFGVVTSPKIIVMPSPEKKTEVGGEEIVQ